MENTFCDVSNLDFLTLISDDFLMNLSADLEHMAEDIDACLRMSAASRGEGLRQVKWWMEYNLPVFESIVKANDAALKFVAACEKEKGETDEAA